MCVCVARSGESAGCMEQMIGLKASLIITSCMGRWWVGMERVEVLFRGFLSFLALEGFTDVVSLTE